MNVDERGQQPAIHIRPRPVYPNVVEWVLIVTHTSYAVALSNAALPAAAWYFQFHPYVVFALAERKNDILTDGKVPLRMTTCGHRVTRVAYATVSGRPPLRAERYSASMVRILAAASAGG